MVVPCMLAPSPACSLNHISSFSGIPYCDSFRPDTALSKRIVLIDGRQLAKLMIRYNVGCRVEETIHIKAVDEEFFE